MRNESYADRLRRLFPDENHGEMVVGGNFVRDITIQVTEDCNLRCTYCYQHNKTPRHMSFETGKKFIDLILESDERTERYIQSRNCPGACINFIGGEPLLEIELIDQLTDYMIRRMIELRHPWLNRIIFGICTNGVRYFDPAVQDYIRRNRDHLSMTITVDGNKKIHDACRIDAAGNGTYDRAKAAEEHYIRTYRQSDLNRRSNGTKITISPDNLPNIGEAIIEFAGSHTDIHANCVYEEGWTREHATMLYHELKRVADYLLDHDLEHSVYVSILDQPAGKPYTETKTWCGGNGLMLAVDPSGDIYPCLRYLPNSVGDRVTPYKIGDVDHGLIYNTDQEVRLEQLKCITRPMQNVGTEHCTDCPIGQGCGDCAAYSYEVFGEVGHRTTYICDMHKARVLASVYYKNRRYLKTGHGDTLALNVPREWALEIIDADEYDMLARLANDATNK